MSDIGKYQVYYKRILGDVTTIQQEQNYRNLSKAFAHWYLEKFENMNDQEIAEAIIDGDGDNGIDAIIALNETIRLYQFKFPDKLENIDKSINETTVLKIINGYKKLISSRKPKKANENFLSYRKVIKEKDIFNYEFVFVSYTNGLSEPAEDSLETSINDFRNQIGNEIKYYSITKKKICDLIDKLQKRYSIDIVLKYSRLDPSYNLENESNSWSGFANAKEILKACQDVMDVIFDENIRLYEGNVPVNLGIQNTASGDDSKFFYFFHNGIVFICDKCANSTGNLTAKLSSASVVNGCQTIVSLKSVADNASLHDDVFIPIRIIETDDFDLRAKITEFLNSQSKIRDSYFLANNTFIKELQNQLLGKGYFLERLLNEYSYKLQLRKIPEYTKERILSLEKSIQIYVAFYNNAYAATAKRGKNDLFNRDIIETLLYQISADRVLCAYSYYWKISKVITLYRKCRRAQNQNPEFLKYLKYNEDEIRERCDQIMDQYVFINTADLLLLNTFSNLKLNQNMDGKTDDDIIRIGISICEKAINEVGNMLPSGATKHSTVFASVQSKCSNFVQILAVHRVFD